MFKDYTDEIMNEILGGAGGAQNKADNAVNFLNELADFVTKFIETIKDFFAKIAAIFA